MTDRTLSRSTFLRPLAMLATTVAVLGIGGCASPRPRTSVVVTPAPAPTASRSGATAEDSSLAAIMRNQLQTGRYAQGEQSLRRYLQRNPDDRTAQAMLRQLTADPVQTLGQRWSAHIVQPGETYSTLAERYLGDANRFLILARYNDSANPSLLRVGQTVRIPLAEGAVTTTAAPAADATPATAAPAPSRGSESAAAKARRLQDESVALAGKGQSQQALERLDEALSIDPRLPSSGAKATALRRQLLDAYHERAIVLYRDQKLDQAIALWDRVLAIAPDYEPAAAYRARALELKHRLQQY